MEIAARENRLAEDEGVVGDGDRLDLEDARRVAQLLEAGAHHLRLAAQAVRVLYARVVLEMRAADLAALHQLQIVLRHLALPGVAAQLVDARIERRIAARGRIDRERARRHRGREDILGSEEADERERRGDLRAVEERQAFLRGELDRLRVAHLADAEERERKMRE